MSASKTNSIQSGLENSCRSIQGAAFFRNEFREEIGLAGRNEFLKLVLSGMTMKAAFPAVLPSTGFKRYLFGACA
jgi:hypothetical protein